MAWGWRSRKAAAPSPPKWTLQQQTSACQGGALQGRVGAWEIDVRAPTEGAAGATVACQAGWKLGAAPGEVHIFYPVPARLLPLGPQSPLFYQPQPPLPSYRPIRAGQVFNVCLSVTGLINPAAKDARGKVGRGERVHSHASCADVGLLHLTFWSGQATDSSLTICINKLLTLCLPQIQTYSHLLCMST